MSDQFLAEIRVFPFNFAPLNWATCDGQLLPIGQNAALFSLLGTNFGGDGRSNFALPNLQASVPVNMGQGPGLSPYDLGTTGGTQTVPLQSNQVPSHNHTVTASTTDATSANPSGNVYAKGQWVNGSQKGDISLYTKSASTTTLGPNAVGNAGSGQPHNNMMPYLTLNFCIALQGIFPARG
jgi:microcystin-dependent protein